MALSCKIGIHSWNGCKCTKCNKTRDEQHNWNGCKCSICDKTRDEQHDWTKDCEKCSICEKKRDEQHDWSKDCEKCSICGAEADKYPLIKFKNNKWSRLNKHNFSNDCDVCSVCGKKQENQHDWSKDCDKCSKCGKTRESHHIWSGCKCLKCGFTNHIWEGRKCIQCNLDLSKIVDWRAEFFAQASVNIQLNKELFFKFFFQDKGYKRFKWPSGDKFSEIGDMASTLTESLLGFSSQGDCDIKTIGDNLIVISVKRAESTYFIIKLSNISNYSSLLELFWYNTFEYLPGPDRDKCEIWCSNQVQLITKHINS